MSVARYVYILSFCVSLYKGNWNAVGGCAVFFIPLENDERDALNVGEAFGEKNIT